VASADSQVLRYIFITRNTDEYLPVVSRIAAPFGKVCSIVQGQASMYGTEFMAKSLTYSWELLSTKARYPDALHQPGSRVRPHGEMLTELARLIDDGKIKCHLTKRLRLTLAGLKEAHELVESGKSIGKVGLGVEEAGEGEAFA
jgi:NADPH:quinone reductase-like Zn-dependent oxidoreductase